MESEIAVVRIDGLAVHPLAGKPRMAPSAFESLKEDIAVNGQRIAAVVTADGELLDGWHRMRALQELGETQINVRRLPADVDVASLDRSLNEERRHLTPDQKVWRAQNRSKDSKPGAHHRFEKDSSPFQTTVKQAAKDEGVSEKTVQRARQAAAAQPAIADAAVNEPELDIKVADALKVKDKPPEVVAEALDKMREKPGKVGLADAVATAERKKRTQATRARKEKELADAEASAPKPKADLYCLPVAELQQAVPAWSVDLILTDPPYEQQALPVYADLAKFAAHALTQQGNLLVMTGNLYLPEVLEYLTSHDDIVWHWQIIYDMDHGGNGIAHAVNVQQKQKPFLWFRRKGAGKPANCVQDVVHASAQAKQDTRFHVWGQSLYPFVRLAETFAMPGQTICDPFLGGGTTALAALGRGCRFIGSDIDAQHVRTTEQRLADELAEPYEIETH